MSTIFGSQQAHDRPKSVARIASLASMLVCGLLTLPACASSAPPAEPEPAVPAFYTLSREVPCEYEVIEEVRRTANVPRSEIVDVMERMLVEAAAELGGDAALSFRAGPAGPSAMERYGDGPWPFWFDANIIRCVSA